MDSISIASIGIQSVSWVSNQLPCCNGSLQRHCCDQSWRSPVQSARCYSIVVQRRDCALLCYALSVHNCGDVITLRSILEFIGTIVHNADGVSLHSQIVNMPPKRPINNPNPIKQHVTDLHSTPSVHAASKSEFEFSDDELSDNPLLSSTEATVIQTTPTPAHHVDSAPSAVSPERPSQILPTSAAPMSPSSVREKFLQGFLPARTCCNLALCRAPAGSKFSRTAVCMAVFPASANPDRRYIQLADITGTVGVTVWNDNVNKFSTASVGSLVALSKVAISSHHGKKQLTMTRDSTTDIVEDPSHNVFEWWQQLLTQPAKLCGSVQDASDNSIISVVGVCGHITSEAKMVAGVPKTLTTAHLVDPSGRVDVKSWNHDPSVWMQYVDRPVIFKRVRVTSFCGTKMCEVLDGAGSIIATEFPGKSSLEKFWTS